MEFFMRKPTNYVLYKKKKKRLAWCHCRSSQRFAPLSILVFRLNILCKWYAYHIPQKPRHKSSRKTGLWCVENSVSPQSCPQGLWGVLDYDTARTNIKPIVQKGHQHAEMNMASVHQRDWTLFMTPTRCHVQGFQAAERYVDLQKFDWTRWG